MTRRPTPPLPFVAATTACVLLAALAGCGDDVVMPRTEAPFTLYGVLSPDFDSQYVRVYPIQGTLEPLGPEKLDAAFTSRDLTTGEAWAWSDSIRRTPLGYVHDFWAPFRVEFGHSYELTVRRSDGQTSSVRVDIPSACSLEPQEPNIQSPEIVFQPVLIQCGGGRLNHVTREYVTKLNPGGREYLTLLPTPQEALATPGGRLLTLNVAADRLLMEDHLERRGTVFENIEFDRMTLHMTIAEDEWWPPGGRFDSLTLSLPEVMDNVENGYGFVTGGYELSVTWRPRDTALRAAGFFVP